MTSVSGKIFNIQRFSIHDGPGVRTTVFFKGCNLNCKWCHNPESKGYSNQIEFYPERCIGCGACYSVCPNHVHEITGDLMHHIDRTKCSGCLLCEETCYANAIVGVGKTVDTDYLLEAIMTDELYYRNSMGGVTFSGGECMLQIEFLSEILEKCKDKGIHTAVDTAGSVPWDSFQRILPYTDLFLYDVKAADDSLHHKLTGTGNSLILKNLQALSDSNKQIYVRIPYIVGYNDDQIHKIGEILKSLNITKVEIIPYHKLGNSKYTSLGIENEILNIDVPRDEVIDEAVAILRNKGLLTEKA